MGRGLEVAPPHERHPRLRRWSACVDGRAPQLPMFLLAGVRLLVIVAALVLAAGGSALAEASAGAASGVARGASNSVAVFGGGVAGLTAAHELAERGLEGFVYAFGTPVTESAKALAVTTQVSR